MWKSSTLVFIPSKCLLPFPVSLLPSHIQENDPVTNICQAADKQLFTLVEWAKRIPHFSELALDDQVILLRAGKCLWSSHGISVPVIGLTL